ncbi:hypothetical protein BGZ95_005187 [Linnemannia exigua]|uniref:F-box domain-containing protein n=1 Tax=Linnemannia exigua TaxID=604196 RepID=A0AAD4DLJ0_9FUNG|nr:hypothetical protein BGZ95_005187 [Linnemannia exigua]
MARIVNLPEEVIALIGTHLDKNTIKAAIRTCWHLYNALLHLLWRQLAIPTRTGRLLPSANNVEENAHRVQCLEFRRPVPQEYYSLHYRNLYSIRISQPPACTIPPDDQDRHHCLLVGSNPQIQDLVFHNMQTPPSIALWDTIITSLQKPRRLEFRNHILLPKDTLDSFWQACSLFEELDLIIYKVYYGDILETLPFPRLRRLTLDFPDSCIRRGVDLEDYLAWVTNLLQLEALTWRVCDSHKFCTDDFITALSEKTWPRLESVKLTGVSEEDDVWSEIIQLLPPLKEYRTNNEKFGEQSFSRLQEHHFGTLRSLNVGGCPLFSSQMALSVLTGCVHLEDFRAPYIYIADLKNGNSTTQDWASVGLKHLKIYIARDPEDPGADELMFKQLSRQTQLRGLHFDQWLTLVLPTKLKESLNKQGAIQLRLDAGLFYLWTLKQLTHISFDETRQAMGVEEIEWILENWTSLKEMAGNLSDDAGAQAVSEGMFTGTDVCYWPFNSIFGGNYSEEWP